MAEKYTSPEETLTEIKQLMERSSRFISLSGMSGVMAGIYALAGAGAAYYWTQGDITVAGMDKKPAARIFGVDLINPVDKTADLGEADFAPIPAGQQVPLSLTLNGEGTVEALLPTLYRRPW